MTATFENRPSCTLSALLVEIDQLVGSQPMTLQRVRRADWEARLLDGTVGRGSAAGDALDELLTRIIARRRREAAAAKNPPAKGLPCHP